MPTLYRYILREISAPFFVSLFVFTSVLFLVRSLKLVDLVINKDVPALEILELFSYIIPRFLEIAIPMSLLLGVILAFGRLSADSELVVLRATGISLKQLVRPVAVFSLAAFIATLIMALWVRPWSDSRLALGLFEIAKQRASSGLLQGTFNELGPLTLYAEEISKDGQLKNLIISDLRSENQQQTFLARHGRMLADDRTRTLTLRLYDGSIHEGRGGDFRITDFEVNNITLDQSELVGGDPADRPKRSDEMFIDELLWVVRHPDTHLISTEEGQGKQLEPYLVELHRRFAIPISCLCIAFVAMSLGVQPSRGGHRWGAAMNIVSGILVIVIYYLLFALGTALGEQGLVNPAVAVWSPNLLFAVLAYALFRQVGSERWMAVSEGIADLVLALAIKLGTVNPERQLAEES